MKLTNHFATLGTNFYTPLAPRGLKNPYWIAVSQTMAATLGLECAWLSTQEALDIFAGNAIASGSTPLASVYSGHQFGVWAGQLGDGRAHLLGDLETPSGSFEIQLKGAGRTPYSRMGDGRAVLRSSIREFLASEAMHGLRIPSTRALALVGSDEWARRETLEPTAVVTRVAPSFIRFGHFEHFSYLDQIEALQALADFVIARHYPQCQQASNPYAALLTEVTHQTAHLMAAWQAVGFCHGVMNTDNMSILGLTLDYGPFQFMDGFNPGHVCNHSDTQGRYAYHRQPNIAYWNLFCLGQALLPLIEKWSVSAQAAQEATLSALEPYKQAFPAALQAQMQAKLGLPNAQTQSEDKVLIEDILKLLAKEKIDYTIFWRRLAKSVSCQRFEPVRELWVDQAALDAWLTRYQQRLHHLEHWDGAGHQACSHLMLQSNPKFILRNHLAQQAIERAQNKDFELIDRLLHVLQSPFEEHVNAEDLADFAPNWAASLEISCSS